MAPQRQSERGVIEDDLFAFRGAGGKAGVSSFNGASLSKRAAA